MNINQILSSITDIANRAYAGSEQADRLSFEVGMLSSKLREMAFFLRTAEDRIKELELELTKDRK